MKKVFYITLFFMLLFSSCGAYFNTFYNTKKLFKEARKEREKRKTDKPGSLEIKKYDQTIEKASKILEIYPTSKYVDDAVMILGECFYYKGDYVQAQRKFKELIKYFPKSGYFPSAKIWLAKTTIRLEDYITAKLILSELLKSKKLKREIRDESLYLLGDISFKQEQYKEAEKAYKIAAEQAREKEIKARSYYQEGECQIQNNSPVDAVESFRSALKYSPNLEFKFDAKLNYARALKLAGDYKNAVTVCSELLDNDLYKRKFGFVKLEISDCLYREGKDELQPGKPVPENSKIRKALESYKALTIEQKRTEVSASAYYRMAQIYENDFVDFAKAKQNYDKVRQEFARSEYAADASAKGKDIGDLIRLGNSVKKAQGEQLLAAEGKVGVQLSDLEKLLLEYGNHPELRFMQKQEELALSQTDPETGKSLKEDLQQKKLNKLVKNKLQLAEIYLFQFGKVDSALAEYNEIVTLFPENPASAKAFYSSAFIYENNKHNKTKSDSLLRELILKYPDTAQANQVRLKLNLPLKKIKNDEVKTLFNQAENDFFVHKNLNKAMHEYQDIIKKYPESEYAEKSLYALGWIQENVNFDNEKALAIYKQFVDTYPNSEFSRTIQKKIRAVEKEKKLLLKNPNGKSAEAGKSQKEQNVIKKPLKKEETLSPENVSKQLVDDKVLEKKPIKGNQEKK